jgi:hypothetical protein
MRQSGSFQTHVSHTQMLPRQPRLGVDVPMVVLDMVFSHSRGHSLQLVVSIEQLKQNQNTGLATYGWPRHGGKRT